MNKLKIKRFAALSAVLALLLGTAAAGPVFAQNKGLQRIAEAESIGVPFWRSKNLADKGDPVAQYHMGRRYELGDGVVRNVEKAHNWYLKAARQGNHMAQNNLGRIYGSGDGTIHDYGIAHMWFLIAAKGGNQTAKTNGQFTRSRMTTSEVRRARERADEWLRQHSMSQPAAGSPYGG